MTFSYKPVAGGLLAVIAAGLLAGCGAAATSAPATAQVSKGNLVQTVTATGTSVTATQAKLSFKLPGKIAGVKVAAGDSVRQGQVLAELDATDLRVALQQTQAADEAAKAAVGVAQAKVVQLQQSAKPENIAFANAAVDAARQKLNDMIAGGRPEQVAQAQAQLDAANQKLQQITAADQQLIVQAQAALQNAQAKLQALQNGPRPEQVAVLQQQVAAAKNSLYAQQIYRDALCAGVKFGQTAPTGAPVNCEGGQATVNAAQTALDQANAQLQLQTAAPTATDLQQAQAAVDQARAQLATAQSNAPKDAQQAQAMVTQAEQALALVKSPNTAQQIQQQRDAVAQAQAQAQLAAQPFTEGDLQAADAGVQQAQAQAGQADTAVAAAQNNLDSAQLKAPADGKVLQVNNAIGEAVTPASVPIVLGIGDVLVNASLPEAALSRVRVGQDADVTFDSLPGRTFKAKVTDIPPAASTVQNLVTYVATITLAQPDPTIRPGMSAHIAIYTLRKDGVLLVPSLAVQSYQGGQIVMVVQADGKTVQTPVQVGVSDDQNIEIVSGVSEGQTVALVQKALNGLSAGSGGAAPAGANGGSPSAQGAEPAPASQSVAPSPSASAGGSAS